MPHFSIWLHGCQKGEHMNKYKILLFDIDDTILDFKKGEDAALSSLFREMNLEDIDAVKEDYKVINHALWLDLELGKITSKYVLDNRFSLLFQKYNQTVDGNYLESRYRYYLGLQHELIDGSKELLISLYPDYKMYVVSNGISKTQYQRLKDADLEEYFIKIFISEDIGYQKPMTEFFTAVKNQIPDFKPEETLLIGDSLTADILGGLQAGIDTCWFNPNQKLNHTEVKPTYEIQSLKDLYRILKS